MPTSMVRERSVCNDDN